MRLSLKGWIDAIGAPELKESLLADTRPSLEVLTWLARCSIARQRGEDVGRIGVELGVDVSAVFAHLHHLRMLEPPRWRDVRVWWPDCPMDPLYVQELGYSQRTQGELISNA
jgi:uncharacterized Fe-S radical SAM superfamily protein PflX